MTVFPLCLNAIEQYMLADDLADFPRCFFIVLRIAGNIEEQEMHRAIETATRRHPLLRALVEYDGDRPQRWIECREPNFSLRQTDQWIEGGDKCEVVIEPIDLRREPGVQFMLCHQSDGDTLTIKFHHACTDGVGALKFIDDLVAAYAASAVETALNLPPLDASLLASRNRFGLTGWRRPLRWIYGTIGWLAAIEFLCHRPAPLGNTRGAIDPPGARRSGLLAHTLSSAETSEVVRTARSAGATVNDLLIQKVFLTTQDFIDRHAPERSHSHQRIMVPTNLRAGRDASMPAANVVAMVNIDRRPKRWTDPDRMLKVLHWELAAVKRLRLGVIFVLILETLHNVFGSLCRFLPTDRCQATCVVSNLGAVLPHVSGRLIRCIEFFPPIRPLTAAAFGLATFAGQMTISLHYDAAALSAEEGAELFNGVVRRLQAQTTIGESMPERAVAEAKWKPFQKNASRCPGAGPAGGLQPLLAVS